MSERIFYAVVKGLSLKIWDDGTQQYSDYAKVRVNITIERICGETKLMLIGKEEHERKRWHIVNRKRDEMFPKILEGPFDKIDDAILVYYLKYHCK